MFKKIFLSLIAAVAVLGLNRLSLAQVDDSGDQRQATETTAQTKEEPFKSAPSEVGNKICPVSGEEVKEEERYQVEYEGKIYNLCCKMCLKDFNKDQQKYLEKLAQLEQKGEETEHHEEGGDHEGHSH